jgi:hypothetical protein
MSLPLPYPRYPSSTPLSAAELDVVTHAVAILPHIGPDATALYLAKAASAHEHGEHEA